ncbi:hypothetical protein HYX11_00410 [Candidatus Woesearchaeota archaeon]|nr:hypothetical protein [Candidatus Woesearchaeota archaeon]
MSHPYMPISFNHPTYISPTSPLEHIAHSAREYIPQQQNFFTTLHDISKPSLNELINPIPTPYHSHNAVYLSNKIQPEYLFQPNDFLKPSRHATFVNAAEEIQEYVEQTFQKIFQQPLPKNIKISILNKQKFQKLTPSPNTVGLSINRSQQGLLSEIFILNDTLPRVLLTIGHELGHILTPALSNPHDEEAKAYAFSLAWMEIIKEHNIANLSHCIITETPADNGLHNISFNFVSKIIKTGKTAWETYQEIIKNILHLNPSLTAC